MIEPIVYTEIEQKNILEKQSFAALSPEESLIHTLNVMDFIAALRGIPENNQDQSIDWIVLNFVK